MDFESQREALHALLENKKVKSLQLALEDMNEFDIAEFLTELGEDDPKRMAAVFRLLSKERGAEVFSELDSPEQEWIINSISDMELGAIIEDMYVDDAVDMMEELPANVVKRVMRNATPSTRTLINQYLRYPENSAGSIMTAEFVDLKKYMNVRESIARIRSIGEDKETIYVCYVTGNDRKLEGVVTVKELLLSDDAAVIEDIMDTNVIFCSTTDDQEDVAGRISDYDLLALPVVDKESRLVGIVTVDDVIDVLEAEATEDIEKMAAITAQVALVGFIPMLMDTGGNSGSQASVTVIRGLSLGDIRFPDIFKVIWKELRVSLLCGVSLAAVNFVKILLVDRMLMGNTEITIAVDLVVCLTLVVTVFIAKLVGCTLPMLAQKVGFDPAVMASPFITTIVDAISLLVYFSISMAILHI